MWIFGVKIFAYNRIKTLGFMVMIPCHFLFDKSTYFMAQTHCLYKFKLLFNLKS